MLTREAGGRLTSTLTFARVDVALNNTLIMCTDVMRGNNTDSVYMAGK